MNKEEIIKNLKLLNAKLKEENVKGELYLYGGAVMCAAFNGRESTHDIDALFEPKSKIYSLADRIAKEYGLSDDWLNDGVKGFISSKNDENMTLFMDLSNLKIMIPTPEYLFAMKCMACRLDDDSSDLDDLIFLINYMGIKSQKEAEDILLKFFPATMINVKISFVLANIFESTYENN